MPLPPGLRGPPRRGPPSPPRRGDRLRGRGGVLTPEGGRVLALDYGRRRIGVAASDPTRTIASPHSVVEHAGEPGEPPDELLGLLRALDPAVVVVGIPRHMDGTEGEMAREARAFGRRIAEASGVEVVEWDERLSSEGARRAMIEAGAPRAKRRERGAADRVAAAILLKAYLASTGAGAGGA